MKEVVRKESGLASAHVRQQLCRDLDRGVWVAGDVLPSERKLAETLRVSRTPLRLALRELVQSGRLRDQNPRGYLVAGASPAEGAVTPMSHTVAVLSALQERHWVAATTADRTEAGMRDELSERGYNVLQLNPAGLKLEHLRWLRQQGLCGIAATHDIAKSEDGGKLLEAARKDGLRVCVHGDAPSQQGFDRVVCDQCEGMRRMTQALLARGCKRIVRVWNHAGERPYWLRMRDEGYEAAHREAGVEMVPVLCCPNAVDFLAAGVPKADLLEAYARWYAGHLAEQVLEAGGLLAVVAVSDAWVAPIWRACQMLGRQPGEDVLVCGFDRFWRTTWGEEGKRFPPAFTVDTCPDRVGRRMVRILLEDAAEDRPVRCLVAPELIDTTVVPRDAQ